MGNTGGGELRPLTQEDLPQTLSYLAADPLRNLILIGFLKSAGSCDENTLFAFWKDGVQKGVGLLASAVTWGGGAEVAQALGERARESGTFQFNTVVGLSNEVEAFLNAAEDSRHGETEKHLLYVLRRGDLNIRSSDQVSLRPAHRQEYDELFRIHEDLYFELVGRPLPEPDTSKERLLRRIEAGRVWVACELDKIAFKADVATESGEIVLIEAVWTSPEFRGQGIGRNALSALCAQLLEDYPILCLSLGKDRPHLERFYERIGFKYYGDDGDYTVVRY